VLPGVLLALSSLLAIGVVACGRPASPRSAPTPSEQALLLPSLRPPDANETCREIQPAIDEIHSDFIVVDSYGTQSNKGSKAVSRMENAKRFIGSYISALSKDITQNGPFVGGDACIGGAAEAEGQTELYIKKGSKYTVEAWQLLLTWYPHSNYALDATQYLQYGGYPIPSPLISPPG
jgi:hypothetical protein